MFVGFGSTSDRMNVHAALMCKSALALQMVGLASQLEIGGLIRHLTRKLGSDATSRDHRGLDTPAS
jgi:hypothetical protein